MGVMLLTVNGESQSVPDGTTVKALVELLELDDGPVAGERNAAIVPRAAHGTERLADGDVLEIVHFVGGG